MIEGLTGQNGGVFVLIVRSLFGAFRSMIPFPPIYLAYAIGAVLLYILVSGLVNGLRGKTKFTLDKQDGQG